MKKNFLKKNIFVLIGILSSPLNTMEKKNNIDDIDNINNRNKIIEILKNAPPNQMIEVKIENKSVIFPANFNKHFKSDDDYIKYMKDTTKIELGKNNIIFLLPPSNYNKKDEEEYRNFVQKTLIFAKLINTNLNFLIYLNNYSNNELKNKLKKEELKKEELKKEEFVNNIKLDIHMEEETTKKIEVNQKDMENQNNHKKERNKRKKEKKKRKRQNNLMGNKDIGKKESDESEGEDTIQEEFSILNFAPKVKNESEFFKSLEKNTSLQKSQNKKTSHIKNKYLSKKREEESSNKKN
jgi:hypothetical protein